jgi:hypothetical protein
VDGAAAHPPTCRRRGARCSTRATIGGSRPFSSPPRG